MTPFQRVAVVFGACLWIGGSPSSPNKTTANRPVWACSGQSNALFLCSGGYGGVASFFDPYADIVGIGTQFTGASITSWDAGTSGWTALETLLRRTSVSAFIWWQGEQDIAWPVGKYRLALQDLVARCRRAAGRPDLLVLIFRVRSRTVNGAVQSIERDQRDFVSADGHAVMVETEDDWYDETEIHLTTAGYQAVAQRIAEQIARSR